MIPVVLAAIALLAVWTLEHTIGVPSAMPRQPKPAPVPAHVPAADRSTHRIDPSFDHPVA